MSKLIRLYPNIPQSSTFTLRGRYRPQQSQHRRRIHYHFPTNKYCFHQGSSGKTWAYSELHNQTGHIGATYLSPIQPGQRVGLRIHDKPKFATCMFACWAIGAVAVPLSTKIPLPYLATLCRRSNTHLLLTDEVGLVSVPEESVRVQRIELASASSSDRQCAPMNFDDHAVACLLHTSGSTGLPKFVPLTHANIEHQMRDMVQVWQWTENDKLLHVLPVNHIHGLVNCLLTPLYVGAECVFETSFEQVFKSAKPDVSLLMMVPAAYRKALNWILGQEGEGNWRNAAFKSVRLAISGSAPLPDTLRSNWEKATGIPLLERYGMTETGMLLGQTLDHRKRSGDVGIPFPSVSVRLFGSDGELIADVSANTYKLHTDKDHITGTVHVKGPGVFPGYDDFDGDGSTALRADGWFNTNDIAKFIAGSDIKHSHFKIMGRGNADIFKVGGELVSALEIESMLMSHPQIADCAVVGMPHQVFGQTPVVFLVPGSVPGVIRKNAVLNEDGDVSSLNLYELRKWMSQRLPAHCLPSQIHRLEEIPRNELGKVNKSSLIKRMLLR